MSPTETARFKILNRIAGFKLIINSVTGCWTKENCDLNRYQDGKFDGEVVKLHIISCILFHELNLNKHQSLHKCDIPACCNPSHLYPGNDLENARDRRYRRNHNIPKGEVINRIESQSNPEFELDFLPSETKH